jgi:protein-disulfide isomerase
VTIGSRSRTLVQGVGVLVIAVMAAVIPGKAWSVSSPGQAAERVAAEVDRDVITVETLDEALGPRRYKSEAQRYTFQRQKLDELINDKLLQQEAARRGVSVERLKETEVKARVRVTAEEVEVFYRERKGSIPASESAAKDALKRYLEQQREGEITRKLLERLRANAQVKIHLERPAAMAVAPLVIPGAPVKGPRQAAVTIVEFSDFQCPFCANAQAVLRQVLDTYPGDVKLVYRHFPLERHSQAKLAAEAAECAAQQGKFWEYHDRIFASAPELSEARLRAIAEALGLNLQAFSTCLETGASRARITADLADGRRAGVTATPTFFINGRMVEGLQPFTTFKKIIDLYLALSGPRGAAQR